MRREKRWRYFCDHCNKSMGSNGGMENHEAHCTLNPKRTCRVCFRLENDAKPLAELIALVQSLSNTPDKTDEAAEKELFKAADGCPACMLAAIRQSGIRDIQPDEEGLGKYPNVGFYSFDYKKRMKDVWADMKPDYE